MLEIRGIIYYQLIALSTSMIILPNLSHIFLPRLKQTARVRSLSDPEYLSGEAVLDFIGLVTQHGYPAEEHQVTTPDGYHLVFHRIPDSPKAPKNIRKPVVYILHGFLASSDTWVLIGPDHDLPFLMADAGYDVWVGNIRGNTYCRSHVSLDPDNQFNPEFWNFSFHEMAVQDAPTVIDYILAKTGEETLVYIGHSMGTTISYVLLSERPEYNEKISLVVSLTPVAFWKRNQANFVQFTRKWGTQISDTLEKLGLHEVLPLSPITARTAEELCSDDSSWQNNCVQVLYEFFGSNPEQLNRTFISFALKYAPAGGSANTMRHYIQHIMSERFEKYDRNYLKNSYSRGQKTYSPVYDIKKITAPVALYCGENDQVSAKADSDELARRLRNVVLMEEIPKFTHLDFLFANDVKTIVYDKMIPFISNFIDHQRFLD